jgi:ATP-dependent Lon protease
MDILFLNYFKKKKLLTLAFDMTNHINNTSFDIILRNKKINKILKFIKNIEDLNNFSIKVQTIGIIWLEQIWIRIVRDNGYLTIKDTLYNLNVNIENLQNFIKDSYKDELSAVSTNFFIKNFIDLVIPINCRRKIQENKEEGLKVFCVRPSLPGTVGVLHGIGIEIKNIDFTVIIYGILNTDSLHLYRNMFDKQNILDILKSRYSISEEEALPYLKCISLRDYIVSESRQIANIIKNHKEKVDFYRKADVNIILGEYGFMPEPSRVELINLLLEHGLNTKANFLYKKMPFPINFLNWNLQGLISSFIRHDKNNDSNQEQEVPYEMKISSLDAPEKVKQKAFDKLNSMNKSNDGDAKSQKYLDGLLKIPFGKIRNEQCLQDSSKELFSDFCKKYPNYEKKDLNNISIYNYLKELTEDSKVSMESKKLIRNIDISREKQQQYISKVESILDANVYGHKLVKIQIKRLLARWILGGQSGTVIGLEGPPGCGKTTLIKHGLAKCLVDQEGKPRPVGFIPLGGSSNASSLVGHNFTYQGSTWGRIADILMECQCMNPILMFDELDKISQSSHGSEINGILTHLTDPTQNDEFYDKYFDGIPLDLSKALIVFTFNDRNQIDPILLDRITIIKTDSLSLEDKKIVARQHLIPQIVSLIDLNKNDIEISDKIINDLIFDYTREAGARQLKKLLEDLIGDLNLKRLTDPFVKLVIDEKLVEEVFSHKEKIKDETVGNIDLIGQINGLYANALGLGGILPIQVNGIAEKSKLELTGKQGEVMKESMACAKTMAFDLIEDKYKTEKIAQQGLHIHCPSASIPKDGPSAGGAICLAIYSYLMKVPIKYDVCMTGEIDLKGKITKIGGLEAKLKGAKKAGAKLALIPKENHDNLELIYKEKSLERDDKEFKVIEIDNIKEALKYVMSNNLNIKKKLNYK